MENNESDPGKKPVVYRRFTYYAANPSLTIWEYVNKIMHDSGLM